VQGASQFLWTPAATPVGIGAGDFSDQMERFVSIDLSGMMDIGSGRLRAWSSVVPAVDANRLILPAWQHYECPVRQLSLAALLDTITYQAF